MPVGFTVSDGRLEVVLVGGLSPREAESAIVSGLRWSRVRPVRLLVEVRDTPLAPTPEGIRASAELLASLRPRLAARCAFVVPDDVHDEAVRQIGRRLAPLGLVIGAFRDSEAAKAWLERAKPDASDRASRRAVTPPRPLDARS